ncbi:MAG: dihydroorotase [Oscillospiraceae bacterium]|nr:dihydroorotase [Oscillospiraceae bacterium]
MLNLLLKNGTVYIDGQLKKADVLVKDGIVADVKQGIDAIDTPTVDVENLYILPGFADVHVHLREPGFSYKETIATGTAAAAKGGFTLVCSMPNLNPVPDTVENLMAEQKIIDESAVIKVLPYASITLGEKGQQLVDFDALAEKCFAFSDDGKGIQQEEMMLQAMENAKKNGKPIVAHCEDESLLLGGYIHDGEYAKLHGHRGICSESEWGQVKRDVALVEKAGVQYHVCHISTKETVDIVRQAKAKGLPVTCETGPHYLAFCDMDLQEHGRWKMNPPIRSAADRDALIEGIKDGTIEVIATDHAPHSEEEKTKGLEKSNMGVVGLETSFGAINTYMVNAGHISFEKLVEIMAINPRKIFGLPYGIKIGEKADFTLVDREKQWTVDPADFRSLGKFTPFEGVKLTGDVLFTVYDGKVVYNKFTDK